MSIEHAREGLEHAHHSAADPLARRVAVLIAALAAMLAVTEMAERSAQNSYLTHHISLSDQWTFYGFKSTRARLVEQTAIILGLQPGAETNPAVQTAIEDARKISHRMRDGDEAGPGTAQIEKLARVEEAERDHAYHLYERYELLVGLLQISIVLASVSIVTRMSAMAWLAGGLGTLAGVAGLLVRAGML